MAFKLPFARSMLLILFGALFTAGVRSNAQSLDECLPTQFTEWGAAAVVTPGDANNVRAEPSTSGALVGRIAPGVVFNINYVDPVCAEGYLWREVSAMGISGWTVEANADDYFIEPYHTPDEALTASAAEDGTITVEEDGVSFVVPPLFGAARVWVQPQIGIFNLDSMGPRPSSIGFRIADDSNWGMGTIEFYPYAGAEDYWYDGEWMETVLRDQPPLTEAGQGRVHGLTQMPVSGVASLFNGAPAYVPFVSGNGFRYITYFAQDYVAFDSDRIFTLIYRGITADRAFFIAAEFPIRIPASAIPPGSNEVRADDRYPAYLHQLEANLAAQPTSAFTPDLAAFDALLGSIRITDNDALMRAIP
ncbi:MAG: hypothetical protein U0670_07150 [Anaerolineae bacterium]